MVEEREEVRERKVGTRLCPSKPPTRLVFHLAPAVVALKQGVVFTVA